MKSQIALTLALIAGGLAVTVAPALAGKGGGSGGSTPPPSIAIASINGTSAASTQNPAPKLGDKVTFATVNGSSLAGWEYPMVVVSCYQDVNGDGTIDTNLLGPDIVYSWVDHPSATFQLGAASSIWTNRGGGPATCRAELDAYGWRHGSETIRFLAGTSNWTAQG